jgi:hypothetical protein
MTGDEIGRLLAVAFAAVVIARHHHETRVASSGV